MISISEVTFQKHSNPFAISDLLMKEIVYQAGFDDSTTLVKFFNKRTGDPLS